MQSNTMTKYSEKFFANPHTNITKYLVIRQSCLLERYHNNIFYTQVNTILKY